MDITQLILDDHHEQRRLFAILEQIEPADTASLTPIWGRLRAHMEAHVEAEERIFYPQLLRVCRLAGRRKNAEDETLDAIEDHNDIRDAMEKAANAKIGGDAWYRAVKALNKANSDHMAEEEREGLTDFRRHADLDLRHALAVAFAAFEASHFSGIETEDKDAKAYVAEHDKAV